MGWSLTPWDYPEAIVVVGLGVYALGSPIRFEGVSTAFALACIHLISRKFIGTYGPEFESVIFVGILAGIIALAHLPFEYTKLGLITGLSFAAVPMLAGLALVGLIPIRYQQGPGFDFWTLFSIALWVVAGTLGYGIWAARHAVAR